jgi:adenylate cyclase
VSRLKTALVIGLLNGLLGALFFLTPWAAALEEDFGLGGLFQARGPRPTPQEVVLVTLDTESMKALGLDRLHRNWPRSLHAQLIDRLASAGAAFIAFDIYFRGPKTGVEDQALAEAMVRAGNVLLFQQVRKDAVALVPGSMAFTETLLNPLPLFKEAAVALAPFTLPGVPIKVSQFWKFKPETGDTPTLPALAFQYHALPLYGQFRELLLEAGYGGPLPESSGELLAVPGLANWMNGVRLAFLQQPKLAGRLYQQLNKASYETDRLRALIALYAGNHSQYLNYYGPPHSIKSIPYHQVLKMSPRELEQFRGKAVFVGVSEAFQWDQIDTFHTVYSDSETGHNIAGVEIAATAFSNLLQGVWLEPLPLAHGLLLLLLWGGVIGLLCRVLPAGWAILAVVSAAVLYLVAAYLSFGRGQLWLPMVTPLVLQTLPVLFVGIFLSYRQAHGERANIVAALSHYLPAQVVEDAANSIHRVGGAGKSVYGVCLATDGEQYTRLSERLSPRELRDLLNAYYEILFGVIHQRGGMVSDVVGDSVLALWIDPESKASDRTQACHAALELIEAVNGFNKTRGELALPTRIGLHFGEVFIGDVGAGKHFEYRAVGDTVNTASRIEGANKFFGTRLLVSEEGLAGVKGLVIRELGLFRLAGKSKGVRLFEPLGLELGGRDEINHLAWSFDQALAVFQRREWGRAFELFSRLVQEYPHDGPSAYYLQLCDRYRQLPPSAGWDGVVELMLK